MIIDRVVKIFSESGLTSGEKLYLEQQSERLAYISSMVQGYVNDIPHVPAIMDIGPHFLTRVLYESITPRPKLWTLGYLFEKIIPRNSIEHHHTYDLNNISKMGDPFNGQKFDLITMCEVVEHLFIPPHVVFSALRKFLKSPGGILIVGTPNAVSITKRMKMLLGENPFHELNENYMNFAAHIREYTMRELRKYGERAGLKVVREDFADYWGAQRFPGMEIMSDAEKNLPDYRDGITIVYAQDDGYTEAH